MIRNISSFPLVKPSLPPSLPPTLLLAAPSYIKYGRADWVEVELSGDNWLGKPGPFYCLELQTKNISPPELFADLAALSQHSSN